MTSTPSGAVPFNPRWQYARLALRGRLKARGLVCKDYQQCRRMKYGGSEGASSAAYTRPLALTDRWLRADWLYSDENFEQARLARLFVAGLAWLDDTVGTLLSTIAQLAVAVDTIVIYTADHGASFLGKGHVFEAGIRVPLIVRWPRHQRALASHSSATTRPPPTEAAAAALGNVTAVDAAGLRASLPVSLLDIAPTLLAAARGSAHAEGRAADASAGPPPILHGVSLLPPPRNRPAGGPPVSAAGEIGGDRPIFVEVGYGRAVVRPPWKLLVVNDPRDRCAASPACRNLHGEEIDRYQCNFTANHHGGGGARHKGACNMTYDAVARHAAFCDRRQLYNTEADPLEQRNLVEAQPRVYDELLALIVAHVRSVEAGNPSIRNPSNKLRMCDRAG